MRAGVSYIDYFFRSCFVLFLGFILRIRLFEVFRKVTVWSFFAVIVIVVRFRSLRCSTVMVVSSFRLFSG